MACCVLIASANLLRGYGQGAVKFNMGLSMSAEFTTCNPATLKYSHMNLLSLIHCSSVLLLKEVVTPNHAYTSDNNDTV